MSCGGGSNRGELTDAQRAYLCAFDDLLYARTDEHLDVAKRGLEYWGARVLREARRTVK